MFASNFSGPTVRGRRFAVFTVLGAALVGVEAGIAQVAAGLSIEVSECIELESPAERLACFESRVDRALENVSDANGAPASREGNGPISGAGTGPASRYDTGSVSSADTSPAGAADTAPAGADSAPAGRDGAAPVSRDATRGGEPAAAARGSDRVASADRSSSGDFGFAPEEEVGPEREELFATISSVRQIEPNRYTITLDNGQVWRQVHRDRYRLRPGLHVRIYPTRWGESYRLSVEESRGFVQVQRVR